ncbi:hypothetical protein BHM03_00043639 [Ensete ventricosum]|nr:hypothetical protein BHM03_00043639 [Ensete ventricosum]
MQFFVMWTASVEGCSAAELSGLGYSLVFLLLYGFQVKTKLIVVEISTAHLKSLYCEKRSTVVLHATISIAIACGNRSCGNLKGCCGNVMIQYTRSPLRSAPPVMCLHESQTQPTA